MDIKPLKTLPLKSNKQVYLVKPTEIMYIKAIKNGSFLLLKCGSKVNTFLSISEYEKLLFKQNFYRIHRSTLLNLEQVSKIDSKENLITLKNEDVVKISRRQKSYFLNIFCYRSD